MFLHHFLSKNFKIHPKVYFHFHLRLQDICTFFHLHYIFFYIYICTFVLRIKEPETPTRSGSVLLWGPAWVRPCTTWSGGETNTVFVFVFFQAFPRQMRLLCLSIGGICFLIHGSTRQLSDKAFLPWTRKMTFNQSITIPC